MSRSLDIEDRSGGSRCSSYDDYDHSDQELYVYDQCCKNCRYCDESTGCRNYNREDYTPFPESGWCMDWKGNGGRY